MRLWRLSGAAYAARFDGGYGLGNDGRWNTSGQPVTYCATGPALCLVEKLVHVDDLSLLPDNSRIVRYHVPEDVVIEDVWLGDLPKDWHLDVTVTQMIASEWMSRASSCLLRVPSVILRIAEAEDRNVIINHRHGDAGRIEIENIEPFAYDPRLFAAG
ncbi:MAG TPA: RES family NAD+ phosphorylase [Kiloniellales bacterium]